MIRGSTTKNSIEFQLGWIVSLAIPRKLRLAAEPSRIYCRLVGKSLKGLQLLTEFGELQGRYPTSEVNIVESSQEAGIQLPSMEEIKGNSIKKIGLAKAVTLLNKRGSILQAQVAGKKRKRGGKDQEIEGADEVEIEPTITVIARKRPIPRRYQ